MKYKSYRFVDGKVRWIVVDENSNIVNKNPSKDELKGLKEETYVSAANRLRRLLRYNKTNTCDICGRDLYKLNFGTPRREHDKDNKETGRWYCSSCYHKFHPYSTNNIRKSLANCRTKNLDPNCATAKGIRYQKLACELYGWIDLNEENNNHRSPIDCYDPKTMLYYQVGGRCYDSLNQLWSFKGLDREWFKIYENITCFCFSRDEKSVERIYKFPSDIIMKKTGVWIVKNPMNTAGTSSIIPWYEKYRVRDKDELNRANNIWNNIIKQR